MNFIDAISARENLFLKELCACESSGYKTHILGNGEGARNIITRVEKYYEENGVNACNLFAGKLVNRQYYHQDSNVLCLEDFLDNYPNKINLVVACAGFDENTLGEYRRKINILVNRDCFSGIDPFILTYDYVKEHIDSYKFVYDLLADNVSRTSLTAYINQKISMDYKYLEAVRSSPQYFDEEIVSLSDHETCIDCGAYDGDSAISFLEALHTRNIDTYDEIISFEPDPINFQRLAEKQIKKHTRYKLGVSDHTGTVSFRTDGTSSAIGDGKETIEVDTLDHILQGKRATFIKMDIEGEELHALQGAEQTLKQWRPTLAICIYHKREDLWEIAAYLQRLSLGYKFYVRAYAYSATELVLYAIP